ncbi:MAG: MMPL family transporter, partial [Actinobacteria bacterium]|nr:MMPL family transporter [Actinomycetota bacterium]
MKKLLTICAGPRAKWVTLAVWLIAMVAFGAANLPKKFDEIQKNDSASFLPASAESTKALEATRTLTGQESVTIVTVYRRGSGLTPADRAKIASDRTELNAEQLPRTSPFAAPVIAPDGTTALLSADIATNGKPETILDPVDAVRTIVSRSDGGGLQVKVTGSAGYSADAIKVFGNINGTLIAVAGALVLFLLIIIYRSPIFWIIPILAVGFAELASRSIGYLLGQIGVTVNGQSSSIMSILVLGAGTDYALLLVARYREELRREPDRHVAMQRALAAAGPAIIASGVTVTLAVLTLMLAQVNGTAGLGPLGALGVVIAMLSMLTLLPALLVVFGRRAFWPRVPHVGDAGTDVTHGSWRRWGERIA